MWGPHVNLTFFEGKATFFSVFPWFRPSRLNIWNSPLNDPCEGVPTTSHGDHSSMLLYTIVSLMAVQSLWTSNMYVAFAFRRISDWYEFIESQETAQLLATCNVSLPTPWFVFWLCQFCQLPGWRFRGGLVAYCFLGAEAVRPAQDIFLQSGSRTTGVVRLKVVKVEGVFTSKFDSYRFG